MEGHSAAGRVFGVDFMMLSGNGIQRCGKDLIRWGSERSFRPIGCCLTNPKGRDCQSKYGHRKCFYCIHDCLSFLNFVLGNLDLFRAHAASTHLYYQPKTQAKMILPIANTGNLLQDWRELWLIRS